MFSDFKGRGFDREDSQLQHADRLERLLLVMSLAMHGCVRVGQEDALHCPTPLEKKRKRKATRTIGASGNFTAAWCPGPQRGLRRLKRCLQNGIPLPTFQVVMRN